MARTLISSTMRAFITVLLFAIALGSIFGFIYSIPIHNIAVVPITSQITSSSNYLSSAVSSTTIIELIETAELNPNVMAIILEINSPGGTVVGTKEVVEKVKSVSKPVVAWIREIGASGAYWIASASDAIVADPLSITGSIGVSATYLEYVGLFEKYGITYVNITMPELKDMGSSYKELSDEERVRFMRIINETYSYFVEDVALNRNMTYEEILNASDSGAIMLGEDAYERDLVDYLGSKELAINVTMDLAGIEVPLVGRLENEKSILDILYQLGAGIRFFGTQGVQIKV